ncbi:hypothetical protein AB0L99_08800 [Streptomyces sp. NPDC051954]|uniref:hypothetical protein n=1 Tax=Streptomyces sp. NPDC051954 TaxID=3155524 RepID=UPI003415DC1D
MIRTARALLPVLLLAPLFTGCGTEQQAGTAADLNDAAADWGVDPELVYVTDVSGFAVFPESVGKYELNQFDAAYRSDKGSTRFGLFAEYATLTAENCPEQPLGTDKAKPVTCEQDGDAWYRTAGGVHEYAVPRDGVVIRLIADTEKVDRAVLHEAAEAVHRPDDTELAALLPTTDGTDT